MDLIPEKPKSRVRRLHLDAPPLLVYRGVKRKSFSPRTARALEQVDGKMREMSCLARIWHSVVTYWLLFKWAMQLIFAVGLIRLVKWVWLLCRILAFVAFLLPQVFLPMAWFYVSSATIMRDVPYHKRKDQLSHGRNSLDIFLPMPTYAWINHLRLAPSESGKAPVVIFLCGGAWIVGYKAWGALLAMVLSTCGCVCFVPDYRNYPQATISDMHEDVDDAIAWVLENLEVYGGDPDNVTLIGQSAGAHLGMLTLLRKAMDEQAGNAGNWNIQSIRSFVGISGPYDISELKDHFQSRGLYTTVLDTIFERDFVWNSPQRILEDDLTIQLALKNFPPVYLFHGTRDFSVPDTSSTRLFEVLKEHNVPVACKLFQGKSHTDPIIEGPAGHDDPLMEDLLYIIRQPQLGTVPPSPGFSTNMDRPPIVESNGLRITNSAKEHLAVFEGVGKILDEIEDIIPKASPVLLRIASQCNPF